MSPGHDLDAREASAFFLVAAELELGGRPRTRRIDHAKLDAIQRLAADELFPPDQWGIEVGDPVPAP